ncbi:MAG: hypothetical protein ABL993_09150 [Vicinamibacterales bacterium]
MVRVFLDCNIYDQLALDAEHRGRVGELVARGELKVIATPVVIDELAASPFGGLPNWFPVAAMPENVAVGGFARVGMARIGAGEIYSQHRGSSNNIKDGILAESADALADILVSEDGRCRKRLNLISTTCDGMSYADFCRWLDVPGPKG